ncbi:MAG TPA: hypothetical protein VEJ46_16095 [Candidatus Acidoferrum sp.]|nr:hypothetical protein [Candidatus Acidoferrum sp.]
MHTLKIACMGPWFLLLAQVVSASQAVDTCKLPADLQFEISKSHPGAKIVRLPDLEEDDRHYFVTDHDDACPGLVKVDFYGDGAPTFALLLGEQSRSKKQTELIVVHLVSGKWRAVSLGTGDAVPYAPAIWSEAPGKYRDVYGRKTIHASRPVIVFCKYEGWAIVYSWTGDHVDKVWILD